MTFPTTLLIPAAYILAALIAAAAPTLAVLASWKLTHGKLDEIHGLVNSRLSDALTEIDSLQAQVQILHQRLKHQKPIADDVHAIHDQLTSLQHRLKEPGTPHTLTND